MHSLRRIVAAAPGKLMLMGEHAVLRGQPCLVAAVDKRVTVSLSPRDDSSFTIDSALGTFQGKLNHICIKRPFTFLLTLIRMLKPEQGFDVVVKSDFPPNLGLGSSAAVSVAMAAGLYAFRDEAVDADQVFATALAAVREVQGTGSGADVAASVYGGLLRYRADPLEIDPIRNLPELVAIYMGSKEKTVSVIGMVNEKATTYPETYGAIFGEMGRSVEAATAAAKEGNWNRFGELININQGLMDAIGVNNKRLSELIYDLRTEPTILGSKISGSGLGDCVYGIGHIESSDFPHEVLDLNVDPNGVVVSMEV